jgi:hypothetical protein
VCTCVCSCQYFVCGVTLCHCVCRFGVFVCVRIYVREYCVYVREKECVCVCVCVLCE